MTSHWCDSFYFELADLIAYRLRCNFAFTNGDGATTSKDSTNLEDTRLYISHEAKEVRNWSFGFEGVTTRKIVAIHVVVGTKPMEIILQRSGAGGRVPVEFSSDGFGSDSVTFQHPGTWRVDQPGNQSPLEDRPDKEVAKLDSALGRPRPLLVDFPMVREWMRTCDQQHTICQHSEAPVDIPQFRLIDVEKMCIVQVNISKRPPFATLSYVWGGIKPFIRLVKANIKDLQVPGHLEKLTLPSTIRDAISVCAKLQIGHLWIDSLFIDKMDSIYRLDAHSGIPGVRPGTRSLEQHPLEIRGVKLIDSVDTGQFRFQGSFQEPRWISNTPWAQRAWTFQESLVSRRSLFFTAEQVYWSCREGLLSEDTTEYFRNNESPHVPKKRLDSTFRSQEYLAIATTFSTRRLTYEADIGRAYLGTQNYLDNKWGGHTFSWGLPHGSFGSFLMWERTHPIRQREGSIVQVPFPSWSWMSWTDGGQLETFFGDEPEPHSPRFYVFNSATELMEVCDEFTELDLSTEVTEAQLPQALHLTPSTRHSALVFYTEVATSMLDIPTDLKMRSFQYPFSIQIGNTYYRIVEKDQDGESKDLEEIDLVAVFSGQYRLYCWPVLKQDGVRIRASCASTVIFLTLWKQLPRRKWELVTML
ncbi:hypothetical protein EDB82DRAFT_547846 [Fusarium venenatum]|uniref:uncharacterized protein n=1 Tax=Fusarium venenatum TaxID=56646 RepID=UPI001E00FFBD|nr:hypothetical protein EDB82DRAFT_547846 [Fusarium venenatum]